MKQGGTAGGIIFVELVPDRCRSLSGIFYVIGNSYGIPYYIKNIIALGAVVDGCQGNRASAKECANGTLFLMKKQAAIVPKIGRKEGLLIKR